MLPDLATMSKSQSGSMAILLALAALAFLTADARMVMEPRRMFQSEGGCMEHWGSDRFEMMRHARVEAGRVTLKERGLLLPQYSDASLLVYCARGSAMMGMVLPQGMRAQYRLMREGEIAAIPRGMLFWFYNTGCDKQRSEESELVAMADTSLGVQEGEGQTFRLIAAKKAEMGGILHGFSTDMLSAAWDVSKEMVKRVVEGQKGTIIIRLQENDAFHQLMVKESRERRAQQGPLRRDSRLGPSMTMDLVYDMDRASCDHFSTKGGCMTVLNRHRLPILKHLRPHTGMGAVKIHLQPGAMVAPGYMSNAHLLVFCTKGSARVQVVNPSGEQCGDEEMRVGQMMMVPMGHPVMKLAGRDGFQMIAFATSDMPMPMHLAGRDSVFRALPDELLMAALNIDKKTLSSLAEHTPTHAAILPPGRHDEETHGGHPLHIHMDMLLDDE